VGTCGNRLAPYRRFAIETDLTPEAVLRALAQCIETRFVWNPFARDRKPYQGRIRGRAFWMGRIIWHRNSSLPLVRGNVEPRGTGALVRVRMRPVLLALGFMAVWMLGVGAAGVATLVATLDGRAPGLAPLLPLGMLAFGYLVVMVGFAPEATRTTSFLCDLLKGRIVEDR
jgi:hypothetical protein